MPKLYLNCHPGDFLGRLDFSLSEQKQRSISRNYSLNPRSDRRFAAHGAVVVGAHGAGRRIARRGVVRRQRPTGLVQARAIDSRRETSRCYEINSLEELDARLAQIKQYHELISSGAFTGDVYKRESALMQERLQALYAEYKHKSNAVAGLLNRLGALPELSSCSIDADKSKVEMACVNAITEAVALRFSAEEHDALDAELVRIGYGKPNTRESQQCLDQYGEFICEQSEPDYGDTDLQYLAYKALVVNHGSNEGMNAKLETAWRSLPEVKPSRDQAWLRRRSDAILSSFPSQCLTKEACNVIDKLKQIDAVKRANAAVRRAVDQLRLAKKDEVSIEDMEYTLQCLLNSPDVHLADKASKDSLSEALRGSPYGQSKERQVTMVLDARGYRDCSEGSGTVVDYDDDAILLRLFNWAVRDACEPDAASREELVRACLAESAWLPTRSYAWKQQRVDTILSDFSCARGVSSDMCEAIDALKQEVASRMLEQAVRKRAPSVPDSLIHDGIKAIVSNAYVDSVTEISKFSVDFGLIAEADQECVKPIIEAALSKRPKHLAVHAALTGFADLSKSLSQLNADAKNAFDELRGNKSVPQLCLLRRVCVALYGERKGVALVDKENDNAVLALSAYKAVLALCANSDGEPGSPELQAQLLEVIQQCAARPELKADLLQQLERLGDIRFSQALNPAEVRELKTKATLALLPATVSCATTLFPERKARVATSVGKLKQVLDKFSQAHPGRRAYVGGAAAYAAPSARRR